MALFKLAEKDARDSLLGGEDNFAYVVLDTPQLRRSAFTIFRSNSVSSFLYPRPRQMLESCCDCGRKDSQVFKIERQSKELAGGQGFYREGHRA